MTKEIEDVLAAVRETLGDEKTNGLWQPQPADPLYECEFIRVGFRSWGLEAPDKSWKIVLNHLDFGSKNPAAIMEAYAPNHDEAFGDLGWLAFTHAVGINGGTNFNQCVVRLHKTLGGAEADWARRITYLIGRAKEANASGSNGTFSTSGVPVIEKTPPFAFSGRIREGRTMSLFGPGSAGKTTIADGLIASACSGVEIIPAWRPARSYSCLVLDWDEGREEEEVRLRAICNAYSVNLVGGFHYKRMSRPLHDVADEIGAYVIGNGVDIVIVSPVGRAIRDHGDNLSAPIDELYEILRTFGTTNILIDHVPKSNMKIGSGADSEYGSTRKRDNVRGSYSVYAQSEEIGQRVVVLRNTKPDALLGRREPQAVRIEYDPIDPGDYGIYDTIRFEPDEVIEQVPPVVAGAGNSMRDALFVELSRGHATIDELASTTGYRAPSVKMCLYRYRGKMFERLPSGAWEALPGG